MSLETDSNDPTADSVISSKFRAITILTDFINQLNAIDFNYFVEKNKISDKLLNDHKKNFQAVEKDKVNILDGQQLNDIPHAVLDVLLKLFKIIERETFCVRETLACLVPV
jgi:hypothetical protein